MTCSAADDPDHSPRCFDPPPASTGVMRPDTLPAAVAPAGPSDTPDSASAAETPPVVEAGGAPPAAPRAAAALSPAVGPSAATVAGSSSPTPQFSKHEKARLAQVLCTEEMAADVVVSRRPMPRRQQDARVSHAEVRVVVVAEMFNGTKCFSSPEDCDDAGLDPNVHPHDRSGLCLEAKWSEVSGFPVRFLGRIFLCSAHWVCSQRPK